MKPGQGRSIQEAHLAPNEIDLYAVATDHALHLPVRQDESHVACQRLAKSAWCVGVSTELEVHAALHATAAAARSTCSWLSSVKP
jgi:hypothetical protein